MDNFLKQFKKVDVPIEDRAMTFGKPKGKTYQQIYDEDKLYVRWVVTTSDDKYIKNIKKYFIQRIESEYSNLP
jgi:hypothetical protein